MRHPDAVSDVTTADFGVGSWIERRARVAPDRPALVFGGRTHTNAELAGRIRRLANGLRTLGVTRGDRVAWLGPNHPAFLETLFAAGQLGAVLAPVNHRLGPDERALVMAQTRPVVLIQFDLAEPAEAASVRQRLSVGARLPDSIDYETLVAGSPDDPLDESIGLDDLLMLPHTSGTTGIPKAVMLSHGNVTWNAVNMLTRAGFRSDDVTIAIAPFFRVGGTGVNVLPVLFAGGAVVVPDDSTPSGIVRLMDQHRVSVGFGNPDLLDSLAHAEGWRSADLSAIRFVVTGGAPVPERLIRAYLDRGVTLLQGYGLSEAGPVVLVLDAEQALRKVGSAGRPPIFVDVRIADEHGVDVLPGRTGELLVRGPNVMLGYWERPDATREVLLDGGWLRTGDAARADADGDLWIVDRFESRFVSAGQVVYPGDVERALLEHPAVADAGVVGMPAANDEMTGTAFVVLFPGTVTSEEDLLAFCRDRLPAPAVPASIAFVDELPRTAVGKLRRDELARLASTGSLEAGGAPPAVRRR